MAKPARQDLFNRIALIVILAGAALTLVSLVQGVLEVTGADLERPAVARTAAAAEFVPSPAIDVTPSATPELDPNFGADG